MARKTPAEVYQALLQAGWDPAAAVTMTAIAGGESGWDDTNLGDQSLESATWGPSFGLFQIRTLKGQTGTGSDRDINALAGSDVRQAQAALAISRGGRDFSPWTVYTSGKYQQFLGDARSAAGGATGGLTPATDPFPTWGPKWLPWNWASDAGNAALAGARAIAVEGVFVVLGLGLLAGGLIVAVRPHIQRKAEQAAQVAKAVL